MLKIIEDAFKSGLISSVTNQMEGNLAVAMFIAGLVFVFLIAYLLGSMNFALILSNKMYKDDIRNHGSKNAGMTNMMRTYGNKAAVYTILGDILKAVFAVFIGSFLMGHMHGGYIAALACVIGHVFPLYYKFRGGKGVATAAAAILVLNPIVFLIVICIFVLVVVFTRFISLGSVLGAAVFPLLTFYTYQGMQNHFEGKGFAFICSFLIALLIILKHYANLSRLAHGKEAKFSFKKSEKTKKN